MNLFKRGYYSLRNNFSKTFVLFLVVFILGNVICGSLAITQSIKNTQNEFRKHYGSKIEIGMVNGLEMMTYRAGSDEVQLLRERLEEIIYESNVSFSYMDVDYYINGMRSDSLYYEEEHLYNEYQDLEIYMCGVTNPQLGLIKNYKIELIEGRSFSDEEMANGSKVALISDVFEIEEDGERRKVKVGDNITLQRTILLANGERVQEESEYEVIGIYKRYDNVMVLYDQYVMDNHIARLYVPVNTIFNEEENFKKMNIEYLKEQKNINNTVLLGNIYLQLEDNKDQTLLEEMIREQIFEHSLLGGLINMSSTNEIYNKISAPIESMSGIANFLLISSSILCVMILSVAVFIIIRNRKHEIGILISLGEKKYKVVLQIVLEIYIIGMLGLGISMISGNELGKAYSNYLVYEQVEESKSDLSIDESKLQEELLENYSFELSYEYIISVIGIGSIVILLSVVMPIGYIVQLKPRKILL